MEIDTSIPAPVADADGFFPCRYMFNSGEVRVYDAYKIRSAKTPQVWSIMTKKYLKLCERTDRNLMVALRIDGKQNKLLFHRLLICSCLPLPLDKGLSVHRGRRDGNDNSELGGDKDDHEIENLSWETTAYQNTNKRRQTSYPSMHTTCTHDDGRVLTFDSVRETYIGLDVSSGTMRKMIKAGTSFRGWTVVTTPVDDIEDETWSEFGPLKLVSSSGRIQMRRNIHSNWYLATSNVHGQYRRIHDNNGRRVNVHSVVVASHGTDEDKRKLADGLVVNHKNELKHENDLTNLEVVTNRENALWSGGKVYRLTNRDTGAALTFNGTKSTGDFLGVSQSKVSKYASKRDTHDEYIVDIVGMIKDCV